MKVVYRLPAKSGVNLPIPPGTPQIQVDAATVGWEVDSDKKLNTIVLTISGQPLRLDDRGTILSTYPELEALAYRFSTYIANCVLQQTGFDAIDPEVVLQTTPELYPETLEEEREYANRPIVVGSSRTIAYNVHANFHPNEYPKMFMHSAALALYADGLRVGNPFQQYELFYKVIEYFFEEEGAALDKAVSNHVRPYDARFDESQVEVLRHLRSRSVHPRARKGHVNPESVEAFREVQANLPLLRNLAHSLLQYPTF